jgi:hypothetical protein
VAGWVEGAEVGGLRRSLEWAWAGAADWAWATSAKTSLVWERADFEQAGAKQPRLSGGGDDLDQMENS